MAFTAVGNGQTSELLMVVAVYSPLAVYTLFFSPGYQRAGLQGSSFDEQAHLCF